jgi:type IV pilus assembly protein PilC
MALFSYKAIHNETGEVAEAKIEAADQYELYNKLKKDGYNVVSSYEISAGSKEGGILSKITALSFLGSVPVRDRIDFAKNTGAMLEAGLSLSKILTIFERQTHNKAFKKMLVSVEESIKTGKTFSDALAGFPETFSPLFISMVRAGEEGGSLSTALKQLGQQMEKNYMLQKKVKGALIYPGIIFTLMIVIAVVMLIVVVPTLSSTFKELGVELPFSTRIIIGTSDFIKTNYIIATMLVIAAGIIAWATIHYHVGKKYFDFLILKIPVIGKLVKEVNSARTARTISSLLSSGVEVVTTIDITKNILQNVYYKAVMEEVKEKVSKGEPISAVFLKNEHLYPIFVGEMVTVGEETGQLSKTMDNVAVYYENDVDQTTKDMSTIIEPFLMIVIGAAVGFFAISMLSPMYNLVGGF